MVRNCRAEAGTLCARSRFLLQLRDVYAVDGSVVHGRVFDFFAASPITRLYCWRGDGEGCSRGSPRSPHPPPPPPPHLVDNGLSRAPFPRRGPALFPFSLLNPPPTPPP